VVDFGLFASTSLLHRMFPSSSRILVIATVSSLSFVGCSRRAGPPAGLGSPAGFDSTSASRPHHESSDRLRGECSTLVIRLTGCEIIMIDNENCEL
jgi:hypothetical protein